MGMGRLAGVGGAGGAERAIRARAARAVVVSGVALAGGGGRAPVEGRGGVLRALRRPRDSEAGDRGYTVATPWLHRYTL